MDSRTQKSPYLCSCSLFSKWNYHWAICNGEQLKGDVSDFRKVTCAADEPDNTKPKIKFKVVPPPPVSRAQPQPPPPVRKKTSPIFKIQKRKVEVDAFGICWKDSWMSLKPPKYLFLKAREFKARLSKFASIAEINGRTYKPELDTEEETVPPAAEEWRNAWKQVVRRISCDFISSTNVSFRVALELEAILLSIIH